MKLGKYGMLVKKHMEDTYPVRYSELIMDGTIMDRLLDRETEIRDYREILEKQLIEKYAKPKTGEFLVMAKYNQMIEAMVEELLQKMIYEKI